MQLVNITVIYIIGIKLISITVLINIVNIKLELINLFYSFFVSKQSNIKNFSFKFLIKKVIKIDKFIENITKISNEVTFNDKTSNNTVIDHNYYRNYRKQTDLQKIQ